jgi:hypothetical protein
MRWLGCFPGYFVIYYGPAEGQGHAMLKTVIGFLANKEAHNLKENTAGVLQGSPVKPE